MKRGGVHPGFRFGLLLPGRDNGYRRVLPFRRSWIAIGILAVFDAVFLVPLVITFRQAWSGWGSFDSLFDLVATLFLSAWMLGWSIAPILITLILLVMMLGREVVSARPGVVELSIGLAGIGLTSTYDVAKMRNLRLEIPEKKDGNSWRGPHLVFDYGSNPVHFGSAIDEGLQSELKSGLEAASGSLIREGAARPEDPQLVAAPVQPDAPPAPLHAIEDPDDPLTWSSPSSLALILANLVPVAGAVFLGWSLGDVMVLYWAESAVIGLFNLLKIIVIGRWGALFFGPFFLGHFGGFMSVHFLFIYTLFVTGLDGDLNSGGDLANVARLFFSLWPALAALFVSHGFSFFTNFLGREEYRGKTMQKQMTEPYSRIVFMHLVLIFGGGLALILQDPAPVLVIVIAIKIVVDLKAHIRERKRRTGSA